MSPKFLQRQTSMATLACITNLSEDTIRTVASSDESLISDIRYQIERYNGIYKSDNKCIVGVTIGHPFRDGKRLSLINNYGQLIVLPTYEMIDEDEYFIHDYCGTEPLTSSEIECIQKLCESPSDQDRLLLLLNQRLVHKSFTVECMKKLNDVSAVKGISLDNLLNSILEYIPISVKREAETKTYFTQLNERLPPHKRVTINFQSVDTWINIGNVHIFAQIKWCNKSHPASDLRDKYSANMDAMIDMLKEVYGHGIIAHKLWICKKAGPKLQEAARTEGITIIDADEDDSIYSFAKKAIPELLKIVNMNNSLTIYSIQNQIDLIEAQTTAL